MPFDALPEEVLSDQDALRQALALNDIIKLRLARDGIAGQNGWRTSELGLEDSPSHCVVGWLLKAADWEPREATRLLLDYVHPALPQSAQRPQARIEAIYTYNDNGERSQKAVVALLDRAIGLAEAV
jgi:hypothetical protein